MSVLPSPPKWRSCIRPMRWPPHYAGFGLADPTSARLTPALAFARLLTFSPVEATPSALQALTRVGWTPRGIVTSPS